MAACKIKCRDCKFGCEKADHTGWCNLKGRDVTLDSERNCKLGLKRTDAQ